MNRSLAVGIGILVLVCLGFLLVSNMTGNVITGSAVSDKVVENEYFKINDFGNVPSNEGKLNKEIKDGLQNNSGSR